ncbi:MAG: Threonine--tRNA ligase [Alphaproteobacteria bacterium MarineAlpha6_Bin6]|nr:threonine--tRNA ligase [Pelagibacteraceae bacterium]PPR30633.1 MAG: Threonine--tRNA ligase [Alphaproteobacteria bacterium MarineAlpha6_Bin6]PPR33983.1 MAG: Threonine--tRNA ligase [Alphaproteobacteria bacterium MarineAlpha6_Bin5]|tara:strand:+ start:12420 stop:14321 length:1902 start_codon:yes stop_codon:yes gene_type:complete
MVSIKLSDGSKKKFSSSITGFELAKSISSSLSKSAVAISINGELKDLNFEIKKDCDVKIITKETDEGIEIIRHDAAHVLAEAVKLLYPDVQVTIGPPIKNGFYYDFSKKKPFTPEDLIKIEKKMLEIINNNMPFEREVWDRKKAISFFKNEGEIYKTEIINDISKNDEISIYKQGKFLDLCKGPHSPSTGKIGKFFKLIKLAGAYWRGDSNNEMLQRIYGTAWTTKKDLDNYLNILEEAEKRDHRKLGREMDLFHFQEESPGSIFWHEKGWDVFKRLENYLREKQLDSGYKEINTPDMLDRSLWEKSGHWEKFKDNMFTIDTDDERVFALKPMNCPGCIQIFNQGIKSYKDLPIKFSEFGKVHRYESSGAVHGMMRVRSFTQDDAHIFCTEDQITSECIEVTNLILKIYKDFGFSNIKINYADRPEKRVGNDKIWDKSEQALLKAIKKAGVEYKINKGEGAFYGPKIEFVLKDAIDREWQCGTVQVDFNLPERLNANYIDEKGSKQRPVLIHRALFGSLERFLGILIEHYNGKLPFWLAPTQVVICTISEKFDTYAKEVFKDLSKSGIKVDFDSRGEKISYKIREHSHKKVPVILIIGEKEKKEKSVTLKELSVEKQNFFKLNTAIEFLKKKI